LKKVKKSAAQAKRQQIVEERRNRRNKAIILLLVAAITAEGMYIASGSKYFNVREIKVSGNRRIASAKLIKLSGITKKDNIFAIDSVLAAKRICGNPWIKEAVVSRALPLSIKINVVERQPFVLWLGGGVYYLLDTEGAAIMAGPAPPFPGMPLIKDAPPETRPETGEKIQGAALKNALAVVAALDKDIKADIGWVSAPTIDGLSIKLNSGPVIMYGKAEMNKQKNYAIKVIQTEGVNEEKAWQYIDVRVPSNPVAKAAA
jgi:cell division protein FtsQ